jgi:hypothetical protein
MKLEIKLNETERLTVKCHRVLEKHYPELELYAHYAVAEDESNYTKGLYGISTKNGFAVNLKAHWRLSNAIKSVINIIERYGEKEVIKRNEEYQRRLNNVS